MPCLSVFSEAYPLQPYKVLGQPESIAAVLAESGVHYAHFRPQSELDGGVEDVALLAAYRPAIEVLQARCAAECVRVVRAGRGRLAEDAPHAHCLDEHSHAGPEVHLFVAGRALIGLHVGARVFQLACGKGDLLVIPPGLGHWFDAGVQAEFVAIRLLAGHQDVVVQLSGSPIANRFARLDA